MKTNHTYPIDFLSETQVEVLENQSILEASLAAGIPHYHACGGKGQCSTCRILVKVGMDYLTPPNACELELKEKMSFPPGVRLACQTRVTGTPVQVHRIIRDDTDLCLYVNSENEEDTQDIGEERELALFFLDIRNFTPFMEAFLPFDVVHILRRLFRIFKKDIEDSYGGKVIETAGDGLYAVFGLDHKGGIKQATQDALYSGLAILNDVELFNDTYLEKYFDHRLNIGIGLHVGKVIVGDVGIGVNHNLTVMGFPVNIAARLQAATKELNNSFVVSDTAFQLLDNPPQGTTTAMISPKGALDQYKVHLVGRPYTISEESTEGLVTGKE